MEIRSADILKPEFGAERFDLVYAWGSLHHTGSMWSAIENASAACGDGSYFAVAIYNTTWFSPAWLRIKKAYNLSPSPVRFAMAAVLAGARATTRAVQLKPPFSTGRAMNVWYDAIDWLGGLPYGTPQPMKCRPSCPLEEAGWSGRSQPGDRAATSLSFSA